MDDAFSERVDLLPGLVLFSAGKVKDMMAGAETEWVVLAFCGRGSVSGTILVRDVAASDQICAASI